MRWCSCTVRYRVCAGAHTHTGIHSSPHSLPLCACHPLFPAGFISFRSVTWDRNNTTATGFQDVARALEQLRHTLPHTHTPITPSRGVDYCIVFHQSSDLHISQTYFLIFCLREHASDASWSFLFGS